MVPGQQTGVSNKIEVIKWIVDSPMTMNVISGLSISSFLLCKPALGICMGKPWGTRGRTRTRTLVKTCTCCEGMGFVRASYSQTRTRTPEGLPVGGGDNVRHGTLYLMTEQLLLTGSRL